MHTKEKVGKKIWSVKQKVGKKVWSVKKKVTKTLPTFFTDNKVFDVVEHIQLNKVNFVYRYLLKLKRIKENLIFLLRRLR